MDRRKQNLHAMHAAVIKVFDDHPALTATIPALTGNITEIKALHAAIKLADTERETLKDGSADAKKAAREALAQKAYQVSSLLLDFALARNDRELAGVVDYTATKFKRFSETEIETVSQVVLDQLRALLPLLTDYNLRQADVDDLQAKLDAYASRKTTPRNRNNQRKHLTDELSGQFDRMQELIRSCDRLMLSLQPTEPRFFNLYKAARIIVDRGGAIRSLVALPVEQLLTNKMAAAPPVSPQNGHVAALEAGSA